MQDNRSPVLLIFIVFCISFNQGEKIKGNDRRSAGLVPYPRIGRNSEMANFPRSNRALGMVHYPRIGRSDVPNFDNLNRLRDLSSGADIEFYFVRDMDADTLLDPDYEDYANREMMFKHNERLQNGAWFTPDYAHGYKEFRPVQKLDNPRSYSVLRGSRNAQGQGGYTPRLGRENEHYGANFL